MMCFCFLPVALPPACKVSYPRPTPRGVRAMRGTSRAAWTYLLPRAAQRSRDFFLGRRNRREGCGHIDGRRCAVTGIVTPTRYWTIRINWIFQYLQVSTCSVPGIAQIPSFCEGGANWGSHSRTNPTSRCSIIVFGTRMLPAQSLKKCFAPPESRYLDMLRPASQLHCL